jgi:AcrR family transcriptional regulator
MNDAAATRRRILDETIKVIEADGDPAVRVAMVAHAAGVTQGMVTYHFRTRSRLIAEAHAERFSATMTDDISLAVQAMETVTTREQAMALVGNLTASVLSAA